MVRIAMIGIAGVLLALQLKALKPEYSVYLCIGVSLILFSFAADRLKVILEGIDRKSVV